jgi:hypothetical protein
MSAANLVRELRMAGLRCIVEGGALKVGPPTRLTDDLRALIRGNVEAIIEELHDPDPRVLCLDCAHYRPSIHRCQNHRAAGLSSHEVGGDFAAMRQNCHGFTKQR